MCQVTLYEANKCCMNHTDTSVEKGGRLSTGVTLSMDFNIFTSDSDDSVADATWVPDDYNLSVSATDVSCSVSGALDLQTSLTNVVTATENDNEEITSDVPIRSRQRKRDHINLKKKHKETKAQLGNGIKLHLTVDKLFFLVPSYQFPINHHQ
ncbi:uncharacterized protein LOC143916898 [Arctopsyche grandis]|uniref:uncharacterized protein LOC143916898 n=1 Tax=Arctopsyche grandis TaxID=121162 RepID=UPI00406D9AE1